MKLLNNIWYSKKPTLGAYLLKPFSGIYRAIILFNKSLYRLDIKKTIHFSIPIIVIGNLTVGGTGKTPLIILLANYLAKQGYKPGIVSRGYGGKPKQLPLWVYPYTDPHEAGDEPVLIARRTGLPVVVDPNRVHAIQALLKHHSCNLVLSDDGLQHSAMGRDIEVIVVDAERRFGNNCCLPAGPLREPITRLKDADFVVARGDALPETTVPGEYSMHLIPDKIYNLTTKRPFPKESVIHAVAGIGNPKSFFDQLRKMGFSIIEHPFPDHHIYSSNDLDFGADAFVIMTEKDAVKCTKLILTDQFWCLPVSADCGSMPEKLLSLLKNGEKSWQN